MTRLPTEPLDVTIDGVTHDGEGVARVYIEDDGTAVDGIERGGKAVFVPGAIPGERVRIEVVDDRRSWARAELVEILEASPDRVEPPCPYAPFGSAPGPDCGGCQLQHVADTRELALKERIVSEQLQRIGKLDAGAVDRAVEPVRTVSAPLNYRLTARFHATEDDDLGFYDATGDRVRAIDDCRIVNEGVQGLRERIDGAGGAEEVTIRAVPDSGTRGVVLHPGPGGLQMPAVDADVGLAEPDGTVQMMRGDGVLQARVANFTFRFDLSSFFQVSVAAATTLLDEVRLEVGDPAGRHVWDLYAGVGLFAVPLAADGAEVTAVESNPATVEWLENNAEDNAVRVAAVCEDVAEWVQAGGAMPSVVVLDPPREGAGLEVVGALARLRVPRIVYVSCDVPAFARDAGDLVRNGYDLERVQPLDCFPQTRHIEVVGTFSAP